LLGVTVKTPLITSLWCCGAVALRGGGCRGVCRAEQETVEGGGMRREKRTVRTTRVVAPQAGDGGDRGAVAPAAALLEEHLETQWTAHRLKQYYRLMWKLVQYVTVLYSTVASYGRVSDSSTVVYYCLMWKVSNSTVLLPHVEGQQQYCTVQYSTVASYGSAVPVLYCCLMWKVSNRTVLYYGLIWKVSNGSTAFPRRSEQYYGLM